MNMGQPLDGAVVNMASAGWCNWARCDFGGGESVRAGFLLQLANRDLSAPKLDQRVRSRKDRRPDTSGSTGGRLHHLYTDGLPAVEQM